MVSDVLLLSYLDKIGLSVKMSQVKPPFKASPPPPLHKLRRRIFHVVKGNVRVAGAEAMATR
jgi:hypothetical protein